MNDKGQRNYGDLVHGATPRMLCDIWRIAVDCFRNGTQAKIDNIISARRRDTNEFPHGLFDPAWRLKLRTVADTLRGYFYHAELKSSGTVGELSRKVIVSLDKRYIGKETSPRDDDNEDTQDEEPITTSSDLVLRSSDRNLQPVIDVGIEEGPGLIEVFSRVKRGKRLTFAE